MKTKENNNKKTFQKKQQGNAMGFPAERNLMIKIMLLEAL